MLRNLPDLWHLYAGSLQQRHEIIELELFVFDIE